mmetsp:Transcript_25231/g.79572  ORF Transcript_25231/g.79572 Transcript_25231/m.79572 type:complete len:268 (+) Transcript_25231:1590-2393(+)
MLEHWASSRRLTASFRTSSTSTTSSFESAAAAPEMAPAHMPREPLAHASPALVCRWKGPEEPLALASPALVCRWKGPEEPQEGVIIKGDFGDRGPCWPPDGADPGGPNSTAKDLRSGESLTAPGRRAGSASCCSRRASGRLAAALQDRCRGRSALHGDNGCASGCSPNSWVTCNGKVPPALITMSPASSTDTSKLKSSPVFGSTSASGISAYMLLGALGTARRGGSMRDHGGSPPRLPAAAASNHERAVTEHVCSRRVWSTVPDSPS